MLKSSDLLPKRPKAEWRGVALTERLRYIEQDLFIFYPELVLLLEEIVRRYQRAAEKLRSMALLLIMSSGGGKSHLARLLQKLMPDEELADQTRRRVVVFSIPRRPTPTSMSRALLKAIGDPGWRTGEDDDALGRAVDFMGRLGVQVVVIDNVQDIPERRGRKGVLVVGNWVRDLWDQSACLILLLGTPAAEEIVRANEQLRRRNPAKIEIPPFAINSKPALARFKRFMHETDESLPLAECSNLDKLAKEIFYATYGIPDYIFQLLSEAVTLAILNGREAINREDLRPAFDLVFQQNGAGCNPFAEGGPQRALDQEGEPFHDWHSASSAALGVPTYALHLKVRHTDMVASA